MYIDSLISPLCSDGYYSFVLLCVPRKQLHARWDLHPSPITMVSGKNKLIQYTIVNVIK